MKFSQNLLWSWTPWVLLFRPQLVRNHFLVSLLKKQQADIVQPFGHFRWSLKRQSPDYLTLMEMNFSENRNCLRFEVAFQYWVLFIGRKLSKPPRETINPISQHDNTVAVVGDCIWVSFGASETTSPASIRESFSTSLHNERFKSNFIENTKI